MATIVRDLLTVGTTYIGDPEIPLPRGETWSDSAVSGGGYGWGQLTHALGLVMRRLPARASQVAVFTAGPGARVELHDALVVRFEDGAIGSIDGASLPLGTFGNRRQLTIRVTGSRGQVGLDMAPPPGRALEGRRGRHGRADRRGRALVVRPGDRPARGPRARPHAGEPVAGVNRREGRGGAGRDVPQRPGSGQVETVGQVGGLASEGSRALVGKAFEGAGRGPRVGLRNDRERRLVARHGEGRLGLRPDVLSGLVRSYRGR